MKLWDKKTPMALLIAAIVLYAGYLTYSSNKKTAQTSPTPLPAAAVSPTATQLSATFEGKLPCADCPGILETITLSKDTLIATSGAYTLKDTYEEKNTSFDESGTWTTQTGTQSTANKTVVALTPEQQGQTRYYLMTNNSLAPLDQDMQVIDSPFNQTLTKKK